ncbi:MAG: CoA ester lyase [Burkholderiales bacterium]
MSRPRITWLYSPPNRADRILKAMTYRADAVIYDLEDAVAPGDRPVARDNLVRALDGHVTTNETPYLQVRVNPFGTDDFERDLATVRATPVIRSIRVPKVQSVSELDQSVARAGTKLEVHALVETAAGVQNLAEICAHGGVAGVSLGEGDLRAALRITGDVVLDQIRGALVIALAAAGKTAPMGSASLNIRDHDALLAESVHLARLGFLGRTAIHPGQLEHIRAAFRPDPAEYAKARDILHSVSGSGDPAQNASALSDGTFIDRPVVVRAQQIADLWDATA